MKIQALTFIFIGALLAHPISTCNPLHFEILSPSNTIVYGDTFILEAQVSDVMAIPWNLTSGEYDTCFSWFCIEQDSYRPAATFLDSAGARAALIANRKLIDFEVVCRFTHESVCLFDTVSVTVLPGCSDYALYIERVADSEISPNRPRPLDSITIVEYPYTNRLYANLRDKYGNYARPSQHARWYSNSSSITVESGDVSLGEVMVYADDICSEEHTTLICEDPQHNISDTLYIHIKTPTLVKLRPVSNYLPNRHKALGNMYDIFGRKIPLTRSHGVYIIKAGNRAAQRRLYLKK